ncbi:hypothetical protein BS47DRAFT_1382896 [Hydnum rufescens UP504]|uniref:Uncharacterized protein n=1 Tax=Hydnum rufescens UP504 TaxID=1448309 RepID=A0A9P6AV05_9AGAM|nr:hypothetical protein BS47DRAFT_1382896 [Hydnum rufescens UP504]
MRDINKIPPPSNVAGIQKLQNYGESSSIVKTFGAEQHPTIPSHRAQTFLALGNSRESPHKGALIHAFILHPPLFLLITCLAEVGYDPSFRTGVYVFGPVGAGTGTGLARTQIMSLFVIGGVARAPLTYVHMLPMEFSVRSADKSEAPKAPTEDCQRHRRIFGGAEGYLEVAADLENWPKWPKIGRNWDLEILRQQWTIQASLG